MAHFTLKNESDRQKAVNYINELLLEKPYSVTIKEGKESRSLSQNKLYWLWLTCLMAETGNDKTNLHEYFKQAYLPFEDKEVFNSVVPVFPSTTKLDTGQFTAYLNKIQIFAQMELNIRLPQPEDQYFAEFYEQYKDFI